MTDTLNISLAQINPVVGDIVGNVERLRQARLDAAKCGADLVVTSELVVCGYPPEDLVFRPIVNDTIQREIEALARETVDGGPAMLVGSPWRDNEDLYNAVLLLDRGQISAVRFKHDLPNYGVFDEKRIFRSGPLPGPISFRGVRLGVMICEDMWTDEVAECLDESGAEILVVLNGSPYQQDKWDTRINLAAARAIECRMPLIYVNQVGGQDELVFDGASFVLGADASLRVQAPAWDESLIKTIWSRNGNTWVCDEGEKSSPPDGDMAIYSAMVLGLRDYVTKSGFPGVLIGMSGGVDSALTAAVAVDALGPNQVHCVMMPSPFTSQESLEDAAEACRLLGVPLDSISIEPAMKAFEEMLSETFAGTEAGTAEENVQARSRGLTLMALSNKTGAMVVSTGNKSEMSVGYATLYGDMCGGYSVLKDVYKTKVFQLCHWRNANLSTRFLGPGGRVVPENIIVKPPTAELKPDQKDADNLPPYEQLDAILKELNEGDLGVDDLEKEGHDRALVLSVWRMLLGAEYKRRQAPPGVKITGRSFGRDRRYPIVNAFRGRA
ncbi:MAG: Glutamine-dependent NAD(+) synthetase [Alphaproteobacteria bacterium MarineAlpha11_Bin1]|nr:MAG: Glutamine-dependent NAD(+) synthetase [Alphaproteobacteria bacterium MarineAlpha11_Bin1]|tara:strand:+ start:8231 stop:9892 length:1662 start_codon:yes stop_codon:yes gene_type:complete